MLDWDDLRHVLAVARAQGVAEAARSLGVHASTVFRRLNGIEARLGVRLFERSPTGYVPTAAGEELCAVAERLEAELAVLHRRLAGQDLRPSGRVRVTTTDTLLLKLLTPLLSAFRAAHPEIELHVIVANRFFDLSRHDADVAIRPAADPPAALVGRRLCTIATAIYGSHDYLSGAERSDLDAHDWIAPDESLAQLASARWLRRRVPERRLRYRVNTLMGMLEAAKAGLGLAPLPCFLGDGEPTLRRVQAPLPELASELWLLTHEDLRQVARVRALLDFLAPAIGRHRDLLEGGRALPA